MTTKQIVKQALAYCDLSNAELARRLDWSPQLLSKRLSTGKLSPEEWTAIGEAMLKIILVFAELERNMTSERVTATMISRANSGLWNGGRIPFGYD